MSILPPAFFIQFGQIILTPHMITGVRIDGLDYEDEKAILVWTTKSEDPFSFKKTDPEYIAVLSFFTNQEWTYVVCPYEEEKN